MNTQFVTSIIISGVIKPILLLLLIAVLGWAVRKKSASLQHFVMSLGVISLFILSLLAIGLADVRFSVFPSLTQLIQIPETWVATLNQWLTEYSSRHYYLLVAGIYLLPATFLLFYLLLGISGLWLQTRKADSVQSPQLINQLNALCQLVDIQRPVQLVVSRDVDSPQTWGLLRPVIMLPREVLLWDQDKQLSVLIHELGHIARWDWLTTLLVKITCACFWFLLPIWWIASQIYQQAEIACDDYIFKLRDKHLMYAQNLLAIAGSGAPVVQTESLHMRGHSPVYQRIMALLDKQRPHQPVPMEDAQYWVICAALLLAFFASVQLIPLQEQLRKQSDYLLSIQWPDEQDETSVAKNNAIVEEEFSWELLQRLKPVESVHPLHQDFIEETLVSVAKPDKQDLQAAGAMPDTIEQSAAIQIPAIQVQGYLPLELATPEYPANALQKGQEGWVRVEFSIDSQGVIVDPRIIGHEPSAIFDRAVLSALKKSRYRPQLLDGQPVIVHGVTETFRFQLSPASSSSRRR
jgi:bla regulator protein blaR1